MARKKDVWTCQYKKRGRRCGKRCKDGNTECRKHQAILDPYNIY